MELSERNATAVLLDVHQNIEEYADMAIQKIFDERDFDFLTYPPNHGFTDKEKEQLKKLDNNEPLKSALRKVLASNSADVIFSLLNLFDGTGSPINESETWTGVKLINKEPQRDSEPLSDFLHDKFYETFWDWKEIRGEKNWSLDTLGE